ncbi:MAG: replication factor C large subunit [archaeon]
MLWTHKYAPAKSSDVQGQNAAILQLLSYIKNFKKGKSALLYGQAGSGKTSSVHAIAKELDYELIEVNASDVRDAESIKQKLGNAISQTSLFSRSKLILVDEIDGISGSNDRGGLSELSKLVDKTTFPIIMTANDPFDKKFSSLRNKSIMIEFRTLSYLSVQAVLKKIAHSESINYDEEALTALARRAGGDMRGATNDLQSLSENSRCLLKDDVDNLSERRQKETMINALMRIFKTTNIEVALSSLSEVDEDLDEVFFWIDENLPKEYKNPKDIWDAYDNMSMADVFRGRIRRREHWGFLPYISELLTVGIALSKKEKYPGFNKYTRTTRILKMWQSKQKYSKRDAIADKLALMTHTSSRQAIQDLQYLKNIFKNNKSQAASIAKYLELEKEEISYLTS